MPGGYFGPYGEAGTSITSVDTGMAARLITRDLGTDGLAIEFSIDVLSSVTGPLSITAATSSPAQTRNSSEQMPGGYVGDRLAGAGDDYAGAGRAAAWYARGYGPAHAPRLRTATPHRPSATPRRIDRTHPVRHRAGSRGLSQARRSDTCSVAGPRSFLCRGCACHAPDPCGLRAPASRGAARRSPASHRSSSAGSLQV
jgi:hypothetical protein